MGGRRGISECGIPPQYRQVGQRAAGALMGHCRTPIEEEVCHYALPVVEAAEEVVTNAQLSWDSYSLTLAIKEVNRTPYSVCKDG